MSHELRTPLNSIIGFSDMLLTENVGTLTAMQQDFLETVARNGRHLLQLISELLDLSKIEAGRLQLTLEPLDLRDLLREAADSVRAQTEKRRHTLEIDVPSEAIALSADHVRVRQVLLNLLSNAIKFTPDGGRVRLVGRVGNGDARVEVSDTGIGIAPADQSKLFKEFVQLDASASRHYEGTGLGLALCKRLVELHGGQIGCDSAHGRGSTFWFTLPQQARESAREPDPADGGI
jgi:signal transduction histidine kinase